jgi:hypothetical protein
MDCSVVNTVIVIDSVVKPVWHDPSPVWPVVSFWCVYRRRLLLLLVVVPLSYLSLDQESFSMQFCCNSKDSISV